MYHMIFAKQVRIICILIYILISCIECNEIFVKQAKIICIKYEYHEIIVKNHIFSVFYRKISNNCFKKRQILGEKEVKYEYHEMIAKQANITFFIKNFFKNRQILGEKEVVGPGGRNNGRLSVWAGIYFFKPQVFMFFQPRISFDLKTGDLGAPVAEAQQ